MSNQKHFSREIPGSYIFNGLASTKGYQINKFAMSLASSKNREEFKENETAYLQKWNLSNKEKALVKNRDFLGLIKAGGNIYMLIKLGAALGIGLYHMGAQQRGQTYEDFMNTRNRSGAH
tara:strand:+ start:97 stop:456 length:360 start_codon:yes stop_codon:yes gene_type:complete